jgi:hypothetical protein
MPRVSIHLVAEPSAPDFSTPDRAVVAAIRASLDGPPSDTWLVPAHDLAATLRAAGKENWALRLEQEEEPSVVTVKFN